MKRFLCLVLVFVMALGLLACNKEETVEAPAWEGKFAVGFGRADVTPDFPVEMKGYGASGVGPRTSENVLSNLYMTCIAMTDATGRTVLFYSFDHKSFSSTNAKVLRQAASEATGVPIEDIIISCTHTHSAPELGNEQYMPIAKAGIVQASLDALADRAAATAEYASAMIEDMAFVRHYNTDTGIVVGSNFHPEGAGKITSHTTEADKELRVIRILREEKKPIIIANWFGHNSMASTGMTSFGLAHRNFLTADYVGFCRDYVEQNYDCHFAMFMGAGGNIGSGSRLKGTEESSLEFGKTLGQHILDAAESMTATNIGNIQRATTQFDGVESTFDINAYGVGDIGIITAPIEMFDTTSMQIREQSPYDINIVMTIANGHFGYLATDICYDYIDCYEVSGKFKRGDSDRIANMYLDLLQQVKEAK